MKRLCLYLLISLIPFAPSACSDKRGGYGALAEGTRVVAFGDSVTRGVGAGEGEDYPSLLAVLSRWDIVNAGISGERAEQAVTRINAVLDEYQPALVLIELGGNDFLQRRSLQDIKKDLRFIIKQVQASGATPVLIAVPELSPLRAVAGLLKDADIYAELAKEEKIPLIPDVFSAILSDENLRADPIHPNAAGYRKLADACVQTLIRYGLLEKR